MERNAHWKERKVAAVAHLQNQPEPWIPTLKLYKKCTPKGQNHPIKGTIKRKPKIGPILMMAFNIFSGTPHQPPSSSAGPNVGQQQQMNIPSFTTPNELNNATVIDSGTIGGGGGGDGNQQQQPRMEREEEDEMRASGQNETTQQQQDRDDEDGSPASGKQLRIAEEEEDGP